MNKIWKDDVKNERKKKHWMRMKKAVEIGMKKKGKSCKFERENCKEKKGRCCVKLKGKGWKSETKWKRKNC